MKESCAAWLRQQMVESTLLSRDICDLAVLRAMQEVPRHLFVPHAALEQAYGDRPLRIGFKQTISQPYIVAYMAQAAQLPEAARVLEIGTGSGYGAAVLAALAREVYTVEFKPDLAESAAARLEALGYANVHVRCGDGSLGWPEQQPFDAIVVTAAPPRLPLELVSQLQPGGRMVVPVGEDHQQMFVIQRTAQGHEVTPSFPVRFVPMLGEIQDPPAEMSEATRPQPL